MKTTHDPFDDLIVAALNGDLSSAELALFDQRLATDPAARAAYQETQAMHDLLEKTNRSAQPDDSFEQRMVSGVRRKLQTEIEPRENAWQSAVVLWKLVQHFVTSHPAWIGGTTALFVAILVTHQAMQSTVRGEFSTISNQLKTAQANNDMAVLAAKKDERNGYGQTSNARLDKPQNFSSSELLEKALQVPSSSANARQSNAASAWSGERSHRGAALESAITDGVTVASATTVPPSAPKMLSPMVDSGPQTVVTRNEEQRSENKISIYSYDAPTDKASDATVAAPAPATAADLPAPDSRKLVRDASLDLEVKSYQTAADQIATLTKDAGGYIDTSNSQRGGNGKLQGTIVAKVLPQNLDGFLLKLRDLGSLKNQSISTQDVTKAYYDTQARLENSRRMETQLQELLKRDNGKISDLLQVERELGRVRGEIEQMQGELKLYDFQVQYATVTLQVAEKDLNQTAAYLLKEQDNFSLFATDVEATFQQARQKALDCKAEILTANLNHNTGSDVSAELVVMVAPEQIETFLAQVKALGRIDNFTRQTQRVARDGGDSEQPADQTLTENDKVQVHLSVRSDDESRKQVALTVVTPSVDTALDQAKTAALAQTGAEILASSLNKTPQGQSTAQLSVRIPGQSFHALLDAFRALGRTASFSLQREDNSGPGANGDDAPVIVSLALTDDDTPLQQTNLSIQAISVDEQAQQIKKDAATSGVEIKASTFERQPNGTEFAQMTLRLPMSKYSAFLEKLKAAGKVESLTVNRQDRPDQTRADDTAPAEIQLQLHNQADIVPDSTGLWATLRQTFGEGISALLSSVKIIGVLLAFSAPWLLVTLFVAWIGRRIYIARKR